MHSKVSWSCQMNSIPQKKKKMGTIVQQLAMKVVSSSKKKKKKQGQKGRDHYVNFCTQRHQTGRG